MEEKKISLTDFVANVMNLYIQSRIAFTVLDAISWAITPKTPYYLRKRIRYLEYQLIAKTLEVKEEIIRP